MLLITGGSGRLGRELRRVFPEACVPARPELDLLRRESVDAFVRAHRPNTVVHAAAYTDVGRAEGDDKALCWNTNVRGSEFLVEAVARENPGCWFVYMSTACVFYGDRGGYTEDDIPHPKNFYGMTKLVGEYVTARLRSHLIVRTNFVARGRWPYPRAFVDRFGTYLYADDVARAIRQVAAARLTGTVHVAGDRVLSMFELARMASPDVEPASVRDVNLPLTVDMTLQSVRVPALRLTPDEVGVA